MSLYFLTYQSVGDDRLSELSQRINYLCQFLTKELMTQKQLVNQSAILFEKGILRDSFEPIASDSDLSKSKKYPPGVPEEKVENIFRCLKEMASLYGYQILQFPDKKEERPRLKYKKVEPHPDLPKIPRGLQRKELEKSGVTGIVEKKPLDNTDFFDELFQAYHLRLIQSAFYNWREFTRQLKNALKHGNLCKVQILLGQPYSEVAVSRSPTLGMGRYDQFDYFNSELKQTITSLQEIIRKFHGTPKKGTNHSYSIEFKIYYRNTALPLYQCLNQKGRNLYTVLGHFWAHESSYLNPHLTITSGSGSYLDAIQHHFIHLWEKDSLSKLSWRNIVGKQQQIEVSKETNMEALFKSLEKAHRLKSFSIYRLEKPNWLSFKCFYYNFENEARSFLLQIDPEKRIAKISKTKYENTYYGTVTELHGSYSAYLHTIGNDSNRTIFINIPVGGYSLESHDYRLAIYCNNDPKTGAPYTQLMILSRLKTKADFSDRDLAEISYLVPFLKEKKIDISGNLQNLEPKKWKTLSEEYIYHFTEDEKQLYYQNLRRELLAAKNDIIFLGFAPAKYLFPGSSDDDFDASDYFSLLRNLVEERGVKITRVLVNNHINQDFNESLIELQKSNLLGKGYRLFITKTPVPFPSNIILIDPDDIRFRKGILSFIQTKKSDGSQRPIRMEAIKNDHQVLDNLFETCLDYINSPSLCWEVETASDLEERLSVNHSL